MENAIGHKHVKLDFLLDLDVYKFVKTWTRTFWKWCYKFETKIMKIKFDPRIKITIKLLWCQNTLHWCYKDCFWTYYLHFWFLPNLQSLWSRMLEELHLNNTVSYLFYLSKIEKKNWNILSKTCLQQKTHEKPAPEI